MALLIFINLFVGTILAYIANTYLIIRNEDHLYSSCLARTWSVQTKHKKILEELLDLNKTVSRLRAARTRARANLAAATKSGFPPAIAAAQARLLMVLSEMAALDFEQKSLLSAAELASQKYAEEMRALKMRSERLSLAVSPSPPGDIAPYYYPNANFTQAQQTGGRWKVKWKEKHLNDSCQASLEQRGNQWFVTLRADKS